MDLLKIAVLASLLNRKDDSPSFKNLFVMLIGLLVICSVGYVVFNLTTEGSIHSSVVQSNPKDTKSITSVIANFEDDALVNLFIAASVVGTIYVSFLVFVGLKNE
jgi:hypothetical protein